MSALDSRWPASLNHNPTIIFDWDQTLWNSWEIHIQALDYAADRLGLSRPPPALTAHTYSMPFVDHVSGLFQHDPKEVIDVYMRFYESNVLDLGHLYHGIETSLTGLKQHGYSMALFSDKRTPYGDQELGVTGLRQLFDVVLFREESRPYKPDPQGLRQVLGFLSETTRNAIMVGDSYVDIECAHRAGIGSAAALWGTVNRQATLDQGPDHIWHSIDEMNTALRGGL